MSRKRGSAISYSATPQAAQTFVDLPEVQALIESQAAPLVKNPTNIVHFLHRVGRTIQMYRSEQQQLNKDLQRIRTGKETAGRASSLTPIESIQFVPPDQLARYVDEISAERLRLASAALAEAQQKRSELVSSLHRTSFALATIEEDAAIPQEIREKFTKARQALPVEPPATFETDVTRIQETIDLAATGTPPPPGEVAAIDDLANLFKD